MRFQLLSLTALLTASTLTLAQSYSADAGVSSIVNEVDSLRSDLYGLSTATNLAQASSLGSELADFIISITTNSDWAAASSVLESQAAAATAAASGSGSSTSNSGLAAATSAASSAASAAQASATSAGGAAPAMVTAGLSGVMAMGVLGAAMLL